MADSPLVTIITATYNGERTLPYTLRNVIEQDFGDFEMWVVGDGCTDGSADVVASFGDPRLHWINLPQNSGSQSAPNNEGLRRARGRYIAFLGHDDLWFPWHLSTLLDFIAAEKADFVHALAIYIGPQGFMKGVGELPPGETYAEHYGPPSAWLQRREVVDRIGFWQPPNALRWPIDYDVMRRAYYAGMKIAASPRLGVLKFPSTWWRSYAADSAAPQAIYAQAMQRDSLALAEKVLLDLAALTYHQAVPAAQGLALADPSTRQISFLGRRARQVVGIYGRERWPMGTLLRWRHRLVRRQLAKKRGL